MSTVVVYQSNTGFTKQYAQWIAEALGCSAVSLKELAKEVVVENDTVIFGGWVMGNTIVGYDKIKEKKPQRLIVFAVGASLDSKELRETILAENHIEGIPFFYMEGGMRFKQLNFFVRFMLKRLKKMLAGKTEKSEQDRYMERVLCTEFDNSDQKSIEELTAYIRGTGKNE